MARRRRSRLPRQPDCGEHHAYVTQHEAMAKVAEHLPEICWKCRLGRVFHVWQHDGHYHTAHLALARLGA